MDDDHFPYGTTRWGIYIKNQDNATTFNACKKEDILVGPTLAEDLGLRWGIQTAIDRGLTDVAFFTDGQVVANCLQHRSLAAAHEPIIQD